ncbi:MAG: hypothetical protein KC609_22760 [Myxococcales bacterium]|nr:hypothetical protein [Myxococcales bacterium]
MKQTWRYLPLLLLLAAAVGCLPSLRPLYGPDTSSVGDSAGTSDLSDGVESDDAVPDLSSDADDLERVEIQDGEGADLADVENGDLETGDADDLENGDADDLETGDLLDEETDADVESDAPNSDDGLVGLDIPDRGSCVDDLSGQRQETVIASLPLDHGSIVSDLVMCPGLASERVDWFKIQLTTTQWTHIRVVTTSATAPAGMRIRLFSADGSGNFTLSSSSGPQLGSSIVTLTSKLGTSPLYIAVDYGDPIIDAEIDYRLEIVKGCGSDGDCQAGAETCKKSEHACIPN